MLARWLRRAAWPLLVAGLLLAVVLPRIAFLYGRQTFLIGDCFYYAETAFSLRDDHDFDLRNQLHKGLGQYSGQISLGARGEWYPKHPVLMPVLSLPFLQLFGINGFLVFNVLVLAALATVLAELCSLVTSRPAAAAASLATICGSFMLQYEFNYSPDLFACLLLASSILLACRGGDAAAGFVGGLMAIARTSNLVLLPFLVVYVAWRRRLRAALVVCAAAAPALIAQGLLNQHMFGSPLVSSYMRILVEGGSVRSQTADFDLPLGEGTRGQLLDPRNGLLLTAPVLLLSLPGYPAWFRRRPDQAALCLACSAFLFLFFAHYRLWMQSHTGNRFLMPLVAFSAPALGCTFEQVARLAQVDGDLTTAQGK